MWEKAGDEGTFTQKFLHALGLSIVKKVTEALQGRVWCESESGAGARFIVELPITEVPPELLLERYS
jgi:sensor histidine kinase regulating citrate/malate metabolism